MAQQQLSIPDKEFSGSDLAEMLNAYGKASSSGHLGSNRPSYITKGGKWVRQNNNGSFSIMFCLGDEDIVMETILANGTTTNIPKGGIIMWSGATNQIPTGWTLCNGQNGTPDLRNRFVIGAGGAYAVGATGGAVDKTTTTAGNHSHSFSQTTSSNGNHSHSFSQTTSNNGGHTHRVTFATGWHTLSVSQIPKHYHGIETASFNEPIDRVTNTRILFSRKVPESWSWEAPADLDLKTGGSQGHRHSQDGTTQSGGGHTHTVSGNTNNTGAHTHTVSGNTNTTGNHSHKVNVLPPYYGLAFIMKL